MWALSNLVLRLAAREQADYDPFALIVWSSAVPVLPFLTLAIGLDGAQTTVAQSRWIGWREGLAALPGGPGTMWARLLRQLDATRIAPFTLLAPVVGLVAAALAFNERLKPLQWGGVTTVGLARAAGQPGRLAKSLSGAASRGHLVQAAQAARASRGREWLRAASPPVLAGRCPRPTASLKGERQPCPPSST